MNEIFGDFKQCEGRYALISARFNQFITKKLIRGTVETLVRHGISKSNIDCIWVPGAFEIPMAAKKAAFSNNYSAVITLGAIIRGDTPHFNYISGECISGISRLNHNGDVPVIFGVLTTDTLEQAIERSGIKNANKGIEAAMAALEMVNLLKKM